MLMISRRVGERIVIGGDIEVTITEIHRRTVRLAIKTGRSHQVLRGELFDSIQQSNTLAAGSVIDEAALSQTNGATSADLSEPRPPEAPRVERAPVPLDGTATASIAPGKTVSKRPPVGENQAG